MRPAALVAAAHWCCPLQLADRQMGMGRAAKQAPAKDEARDRGEYR
jgi:hypothetical protein